MKRLIIILLVFINLKSLSQCSPSVGPPPLNSSFNTGTNGIGGTLTISSNDLSWKVAVNSISGPYNPAKVIAPIVGYYYNSPWADCAWISHNLTAAHSGNVDYFYRIDFNLPCYNLCGQSYDKENTFCLNLDFFADNSVFEIYANGKPQSTSILGIPLPNPYFQAGYSATGMVSVSLCKNWKSGNNSLIVHIVSAQPYAGFLAQASIMPRPPIPNNINSTICQGEIFKLGSQNLTESGIYKETFYPSTGCDSIVLLNLKVLPTSSSKYDTTICQSQLPFWGHDLEGNYIDTLVAANGCDSIRALRLSVIELPTINFNNTKAICSGRAVELLPNLTPNTLPVTYKWSIGATTPSISVTQAGTYELTVTNGACSSKSSVTVASGKPPVLRSDETVCLNSSAQLLDAGATGQNFTYLWTPSNTTNATLNVSQIGKYQVKVTSPDGCEATRTIDVVASPQLELGSNKTICEGESISLTPSINATGGVVYRWNTGATSPSLNVNQSGVYKLTISQVSCSAIDSVEVRVNPVPILLSDETTCQDKPLIAGSIDANLTYLWEHSGESSREINVSQDGVYKVKIINQFGCSKTRTLTVMGPCSARIFAPDIFTPNGDGINDTFKPIITGGVLLKLMVYDRWGNIIFSDESNTPEWDGRLRGQILNGVFAYRLAYRTFMSNEESVYRGVINILR